MFFDFGWQEFLEGGESMRQKLRSVAFLSVVPLLGGVVWASCGRMVLVTVGPRYGSSPFIDRSPQPVSRAPVTWTSTPYGSSLNRSQNGTMRSDAQFERQQSGFLRDSGLVASVGNFNQAEMQRLIAINLGYQRGHTATPEGRRKLADKFLEKADYFAKRGRTDLARDWYALVKNAYPDTPSAVVATKRLSEDNDIRSTMSRYIRNQ
jgi:hypothetical protein